MSSRYFNILIVLSLFLQSCFLAKKNKTNDPESLKQKQSVELNFMANYVDACAARMKGDFKKALTLFTECNTLMPENIPVKYELATVSKLLNINDQAIKFSEICAKADPKNEWYRIILIDSYRAVGDFKQVIKLEEKLVDDFPYKPEFKENLALDYAYIGQYHKSYEIYNELEKTFGINEQLTLNKIKLLEREKKFGEIEGNILKLVETDKTNTRYLLYLAEHYDNIHQPEKAFKIYSQILEIDPTHPTVHLALSDFYKSKNDDEKAFDELKLAFLNAELSAGIKYRIANAFFESSLKYPESPIGKQFDELIQTMLQVHPSSPEANTLYGEYLMSVNDYYKASGYFIKSLAKEKNDYQTWEKLIKCDKRTRSIDSLEKHSALAMENFPNQPVLYLYNGMANIDLKNYKKAINSLRDGLEFVIDNNLMMTDFYILLGKSYHYNKEGSKSNQAFDNALKINSDNKEVINTYVNCLLQRNEDLDKAEKLAQKNITLNPANAEFMKTLGLVLVRQKKTDEAIKWLLKANQEISDSELLESLGDAYLLLNNKDKAKYYWNEAIKKGGNIDSLNSKIKL